MLLDYLPNLPRDQSAALQVYLRILEFDELSEKSWIHIVFSGYLA